MKKMKLLAFALSGILAVSSMCGITASASDLYEIPESITSIKELEDFITSPVEISAKDYVRLSNQMTEEELEEFFKSNGASDSDAELNVNAYYDGMKEVAESNCTFIIYPEGITYPEGIDPDYILPSDLPQTPLGAPIFETLTETSGTFESGVTYFYNEKTMGLVFDGTGVLSNDEYAKAIRSFDEEFIFIGKDVIIDTIEGTDVSSAVMDTQTSLQIYGCEDTPLKSIFTYEGSDFSKKVDSYSEKYSINENDYVYYTVDDNTDPYTFVNPMKKIPVVVNGGGLLWNDDLTGTSPIWNFKGTTEAGVLTIASLHDTSYTLNDVLEISKDYNPTEVCLGAEMSVLPAELQNCETIEEAEAELLRLINEAKADETMEAVNIDTPTIAGDLDLDDKHGMSDIVFLTKYTASPELYPITDATALANADVNQDGVIDSIDTNLLIEMTLGSFESAV